MEDICDSQRNANYHEQGREFEEDTQDGNDAEPLGIDAEIP